MQVDVIDDEHQWRTALQQFEGFDFVHTYDFHKISQLNGEGSPVLFVIKNETLGAVGIWPLLKRRIGDSNFFDLTSVYGYAGPIFKSGLSSIQQVRSIETLFRYLESQGFVSLFSRLHPLFPSSVNELPSYCELSDVIIIEVNDNPEDILSSYRRDHRYDIRKALRDGLQITVDYDCDGLESFVQIYQQTMSTLKAKDYYQFDLDYFRGLVAAQDFEAFLIHASYENKKIASSIFIVTNNVMHYYLSGALAEYKHLSAPKAIIAKAHELAIEQQLKYLILGGGLGSQEDSLFKFKEGFSKNSLRFSVVKKILNQSLYQQLCSKADVAAANASFFPAYRA